MQPDPIPNEGASSQQCSQCGHRSPAEWLRCERCGRRFGERNTQALLGLEIAEGLAAAPDGPGLKAEPEWRRELTRKLEGYRDRKKLSDEQTKKMPARQPNETSRGLTQPGIARDQVAAAVKRLEADLDAAATPTPDGAYLPPLKRADAPQDPRPALPSEVLAQELIEKGAEPAPKQDAGQPAGESGQRVSMSAPIGIRAVAALLDLAIVAVALGVFLGVAYFIDQTSLAGEPTPRLLAMFFCVLLAFYWIFYLRYLGRTVGMVWMRLRVVAFDGGEPTAAQRRNRAFGTLLSAAALGIGFAWAAADEQRYTWHDRVSKTCVALDGPETEKASPDRPRKLPPTARLVRRG